MMSLTYAHNRMSSFSLLKVDVYCDGSSPERNQDNCTGGVILWIIVGFIALSLTFAVILLCGVCVLVDYEKRSPANDGDQQV